MERIQKNLILKDLEKKIVLLVGPRQSGKTWLAKNIADSFKSSIYLNYDQVQDRDIMYAQSWLPNTDLLILDELHKMNGWKNYLKGIYDTKPKSMRILVTDSARLDIYDQLGDSLAGRYFRHRLLPFSLAELSQLSEPIDFERLQIRSGFPEPYLVENDIEADRWRLQYISSLLSTDIFEFEQIFNLKAMQLIFNLLRTRVGSPISYQSLAEDVAISPTTVKKYIQILEALFVVFRVTPYSKNIARSLLKESKLYFFDTGLVIGDEGAKLENLVAVSLLKHAYALTDYQAKEYSLHYLRTKDGIEVDFALVLNNQVESIIEVKLSDVVPSNSLHYFKEKYNYRSIQLVKFLKYEHQKDHIEILDVGKFLAHLYL
ncbi:MAG TPA: ATP-binding protein [Candidatus Babeliales bacterium]|nr:ATP-binding protein [Candidatus Babeliales bacterium]